MGTMIVFILRGGGGGGGYSIYFYDYLPIIQTIDNSKSKPLVLKPLNLRDYIC